MCYHNLLRTKLVRKVIKISKVFCEVLVLYTLYYIGSEYPRLRVKILLIEDKLGTFSGRRQTLLLSNCCCISFAYIEGCFCFKYSTGEIISSVRAFLARVVAHQLRGLTEPVSIQSLYNIGHCFV